MPVPQLRRLPGLLARGIAATALVTAACTLGPEDESASPPTSDPTPAVLPLAAADETIADDPAEPPRSVPTLAPTGTEYRSCVTDYRGIDWEAHPAAIVAAHRRAATVACTAEDWYDDTAFQNGILTFMLLVGEDDLAAAAPESDEPAAMAESLAAQGFDRLATLEVASSGWCHEGEVQVALATLDPAVPGPTEARSTTSAPVSRTPGLAAIVAKAEASGAVVEPGPAMTVLTGGGVACATAIVHADDVVGWVTAADGDTVRAAVALLALP